MIPLIFSHKYKNIDKYAKKQFLKFWCRHLNCGSILDNLEINPLVRTTVLYYTVQKSLTIIRYVFLFSKMKKIPQLLTLMNGRK